MNTVNQIHLPPEAAGLAIFASGRFTVPESTGGDAETARQRMIDISAEAEGIQAKADAESRELTPIEQHEVGKLLAQFEKAEAEFNTHRSAGRRSGPTQFGGNDLQEVARALPRNQTPFSLATGRRIADLAGETGRRALSLDGWKSSDEFLRTVAHGLSHKNLRAAANTEGVGVDGGFMVPPQLLADILDASLEQENIRPRARIYLMASNNLTVAGIDRHDHTGGSIGGLTGNWVAEGFTNTPQKLKLRTVLMTAKKLALFTQVSNELVMDGLNFETQLVNAMSDAAQFDLDDAFLNGDGVGKPLGILNASSRITVNKEGSQSAATILTANVVNMFARLHPALHRTAVWIVSPSTLPQLFTMTLGGTTANLPVYLPPNGTGGTPGLADRPNATLLGLPVLLSEKSPALGSEGDIVLVGLSEYGIGMRLDTTLQRSVAPGWYGDLSDWRLILRVDGTPLWASAITPKNGGATLSWCITLQAR